MSNIKGIRLILKDGTKDNVDPVDLDVENSFSIQITNTHGTYHFNPFDVDRFETYDICDECGYELKNGVCDNYSCISHE